MMKKTLQSQEKILVKIRELSLTFYALKCVLKKYLLLYKSRYGGKKMYLKDENRKFHERIESIAERFYSTYNRVMNYHPIESTDLYEDGYYEYRTTHVKYKNKISEIDKLSQTYLNDFDDQVSTFQYLVFQLQLLDRFHDKYDSYIEGKSFSRDELEELDQKYWRERAAQKEVFEKAFNDLFVPIYEEFKFAYIEEKYDRLHRY